MASARLASPITLGTLAVMMAFSSIATDLYLPAIPEMTRALDAAPGLIEASVASFLAGFVLGQLFWGPVSDAKGRKGPLLIGIALFIASCAGCALAQSGEAILAWRTLQGFGGSAAVVIARAMVSDLFDKDDAAKTMSSLIAVMAIAPMIGPLIGAQILRWGEWPAIFWALCIIAALALALAANLPETLPARQRSANIRRALNRYGAIATTPLVLRFSITGSCFYAGLFAFIAAGPAVFMEGYGFSPSLFAGLLALGTACVIAANLVNVRLIGAIGTVAALRLGATICAASGLAALLANVLFPSMVAVLIAALMGYMAMAGLIVANAMTGAIKAAMREAGGASAFVGAMNFGGGCIGALAVSLLRPGDGLGLTGVLAICGLLTLLAALRLRGPAG